jgi:hemerythrin-like domain-containing protein
MAVQLGSRGQADFSQPIELLMDCHRRIENFLGVLERVVERYADSELDDEARRALTTALDYFRDAAPKHTQDEEESLLPRLRAQQCEGLAQVLADAERIERDHQRAAAMHDRVDEVGRRWLAEGRVSGQASARLRDDLHRLRLLYTGHIAFEDERLFPAAAEALGRQELAQMGREMAHRRGLAPDRTTNSSERS